MEGLTPWNTSSLPGTTRRGSLTLDWDERQAAVDGDEENHVLSTELPRMGA
jgi:hypothetical protein